jgi:hypothetical protein
MRRKNIGVQTFLVIWRLKALSRKITVVVILVEAAFMILNVAIVSGVHTHPPNEYFGAPTPVWHRLTPFTCFFCAYATRRSIGAGSVKDSHENESPWAISGSGSPSSAPSSCTSRSSCYISGWSPPIQWAKSGTCQALTSSLFSTKPEMATEINDSLSLGQPSRATELKLSPVRI